MSRAEEEVDEVTGMSLADMAAAAEDLYEHREEAVGDEVPSEPTSGIRSVVSVRFGRGELDSIVAAAAAAGQPVSTYIRNAALAASAAIDLEAARRDLRTAANALDEFQRRLGTVA
ncbi:plasmid mobilization protein [Dactylosporangium sp. CA-233914]|uniref:plasmid mobilization protein n=1 Tax=Dactylosporangium sp. CA-233914 TaxID=3239934 RepID=UPI003D8A38D5